MNALHEIVKLMPNADRLLFIQYLKAKNKRHDVQNIALFKSLQTDDIKRNKNDKNSAAHHAMRKRLYDSLIAFMGNRAFENDASAAHEATRLLLVARLFFEHKLYREAFKCVDKAERKAQDVENFGLLNEVYQIRIQYNHFNPAADLESIVQCYNANREKLEQEERMNIAYALLRKELAAIYHKGKVIDFTAFIKTTMQQQGIAAAAITYKSLYQILFIANEYASINSDYTLVEKFADSSYAFIAGKQAVTGSGLYYQIYALYLLANIQFRTGRFNRCTTCLDEMKAQMQQENNKYYSRFYLRYVLLAALTENYSGNPGAATHMAEKALKKTTADVSDMNDLRLALLVFYLQQADRTAFKLLLQFNHTDSWYEKKMGMDWAIKKKMVEVLLHAEFENTEIALTQLKAFKKRYKKYLQDVNEERVLAYAAAVEAYITKPEAVHTPQFKESLLTLMPAKQGIADVFVLGFIAWLQAKAGRKPVYHVTLQLVAYFSPSHSA